MSIESFRKTYLDASMTIISPELLRHEVGLLQEKHGGSVITALAHKFIEEGIKGARTGADGRTNYGAFLLGHTIIAIEQLIVEGIFDHRSFIEEVSGRKVNIDAEKISLTKQYEMLLAAHNDPTLCCFFENTALLLPKLHASLMASKITFGGTNNPEAEEISFMDLIPAQIPTFRTLAKALIGERPEPALLTEVRAFLGKEDPLNGFEPPDPAQLYK